MPTDQQAAKPRTDYRLTMEEKYPIDLTYKTPPEMEDLKRVVAEAKDKPVQAGEDEDAAKP